MNDVFLWYQYKKFGILMKIRGIGEMTRAFKSTLAEDLDLIPSTHVVAHKHL